MVDFFFPTAEEYNFIGVWIKHLSYFVLFSFSSLALVEGEEWGYQRVSHGKNSAYLWGLKL